MLPPVGAELGAELTITDETFWTMVEFTPIAFKDNVKEGSVACVVIIGKSGEVFAISFFASGGLRGPD